MCGDSDDYGCEYCEVVSYARDGGGTPFSMRRDSESARRPLPTANQCSRWSQEVAVLSLLLAALGIHGLVSYWVTQRTSRFGIRMALGASAGSVIRLVVGHCLRLAAAGIVGGLAVSFLLAHDLFAVIRHPWVRSCSPRRSDAGLTLNRSSGCFTSGVAGNTDRRRGSAAIRVGARQIYRSGLRRQPIPKKADSYGRHGDCAPNDGGRERRPSS